MEYFVSVTGRLRTRSLADSTAMSSVDEAIKVLHAEALHLSDRHDRTMQGQERVLTVVVALIAASLVFAASGKHPEIYAALPIALGLIFAFLLQLYADAESKMAYHKYLQTLINSQLGVHKPAMVAELAAKGTVMNVGTHGKDILMYDEIVKTRAFHRNPSQLFVSIAYVVIIAALFAKGISAVRQSNIQGWQEGSYYAGVGIVFLIIALAFFEFTRARKDAEEAVGLPT
jgi:hypothetical protein